VRAREERPAGHRPARPGSGVTASLPPAPAPAPTSAGGALYRRYCQRCHETDGSGQRDRLPEIPNFRDQAWHRVRNDFELTASILDGKGPHMPAFAERLDERQIEELVAYLRAFGPGGRSANRSATAQSASDFEVRFRQLKKELADLQRQFQELSDR
jgi:mono/diheme cytochrome c family protein